MLPVIPFDILLPLVVATVIATIAVVTGILVRRLIVEWYNRGGERQIQEAETLLLSAWSGDRNEADVRRWLETTRPSRIDAFMRGALRAREERDDFDDWLYYSGAGEPLAELVRPSPKANGRLGRLHSWRRRWARVAAADTLGRVQLEEGSEALAEALHDPDPEVVYAAAQGLARSNTPWAASVIMNSIGTNDRINDSRLATLVEYMTCDLRPVLEEVLDSDNPTLRYWAITLIGRKKIYEVVEDIRPHLESEAANVRGAATRCIGELGVPLTEYWLTDRLDDDAWFVRSHAARALGKLGASWASEPLAVMLSSGQWWVRANCVDALVDIGSDCWDDVEQVLLSDDQFARNSAVEVLARTGWTEATVERAAKGSRTADRLLEAFALNGGLGYMENALFNVELESVPYLLDVLYELGDDATYGRLRAAGETYPDELQEKAFAIADAIRAES